MFLSILTNAYASEVTYEYPASRASETGSEATNKSLTDSASRVIWQRHVIAASRVTELYASWASNL